MNFTNAIIMLSGIPPWLVGFLFLGITVLLLGAALLLIWLIFLRHQTPGPPPPEEIIPHVQKNEPLPTDPRVRRKYDFQDNVARRIAKAVAKTQHEVGHLGSSFMVKSFVHEISAWLEMPFLYPLFTVKVDAHAPGGFEISVEYRNGDKSHCGLSEAEIVEIIAELRERILTNYFSKSKPPVTSKKSPVLLL